MKSGFVTLIGRPNSGKSSLVNLLIGKKVVGVSPKPQTTQRQVRGVLNIEETQIVFIDTPGIYESNKKSHLDLLNTAKHALEDVELVLFVVDPTRDFGKEDEKALEILSELKLDVFLVITKIDKIKKELDIIAEKRVEKVENKLKNKLKETFLVSNKTGEGQEILLKALMQEMPKHDWYYDSQELDRQEIKERTIEFLNEACFQTLARELPYELKYNISNVEITDSIIRIEASILTKRESQKKIIVGERGRTVEKIGTMARKSLESAYKMKVFLDLKVT